MNVSRSDVVLIDYPFSRGGGSKVRPVLVIQNDRDNQRLANTIIGQITSRTDRSKSETTQLLIGLSTPEGRQSGLRTNSAINCANIFTIHQDDVLRRLGRLDTKTMRQVNLCLRAAMGMT